MVVVASTSEQNVALMKLPVFEVGKKGHFKRKCRKKSAGAKVLGVLKNIVPNNVFCHVALVQTPLTCIKCWASLTGLGSKCVSTAMEADTRASSSVTGKICTTSVVLSRPPPPQRNP
jgi:hypothetical protein